MSMSVSGTRHGISRATCPAASMTRGKCLHHDHSPVCLRAHWVDYRQDLDHSHVRSDLPTPLAMTLSGSYSRTSTLTAITYFDLRVARKWTSVPISSTLDRQCQELRPHLATSAQWTPTLASLPKDSPTAPWPSRTIHLAHPTRSIKIFQIRTSLGTGLNNTGRRLTFAAAARHSLFECDDYVLRFCSCQ